MGGCSMRLASILVVIALLATLSSSEQEALLQSLPADLLASIAGGDLLSAAGNVAGQSSKGGDPLLDSLSMMGQQDGDIGAAMKMMQSAMIHNTKPSEPFMPEPEGKFPFMKPVGVGVVPVPKKVLKALPIKKKVVLKTAVGGKMLAAPKLKAVVALKAKPKVYSLKPIIHVVEKPVPVFHKVPVPKKVIIPKFYKVMKPIPVPKIVPVPFKVPIKKIIPKIVKIPKAIPVPKFYPVKKPVPIGIPYPVPKFYKVPIPKPVPYKKFIPIPIPKKVPKFIPVPVKKIIKVPKPYYVPIKVPHFTASYVKTPMTVKVPGAKKTPFHVPDMEKFDDDFNFISNEDKPVFQMKDSEEFLDTLKPL